MIRLGITGGIGSGKSYVCRMLDQKWGIPVYNCDQRARALIHDTPEIVQHLRELIPRLYDSEGRMDRERMAAYLFASDANARRVNAIVHPAVRRDLRQWYHLQGSHPIVAVESAILYESGFDTEVDRVLFVEAPLDVRLRRTIERDGLSRGQVEQRIRLQQAERAGERADLRVVNDGQTPLDTQLEALIETLNKEITVTQ